MDEGYRASFVKLGPAVPAALYEPDAPTENARIAFLFMHPDGNFIGHPGCVELVRRGYRTLGVNSHFANVPGPTGGPYVYHEVIPDAAAAVAYLRSLPGVDKIVLAGHSGGGPLFAAYQNLAENGASAFQTPGLLTAGPDSLDGLPPADAVVLLDAHVGYGSHALITLDASIVDEMDPSRRDPDLDMFEARNGYEDGSASFSEEFVLRYTAAQASRMDRLIAHAQNRIAALDAGRGFYPDDEPMIVPGIGAARLFGLDTNLLSHTQRKWKLLKGDGSQSVEVVHSLRPPAGHPADQRGYGGVLLTSVRRFLATHAIRTFPNYGMTEDSLVGIDWHSSYTSAPANLEGVTVPVLSLVMGAHYFLVPNEVNFSHLASLDREMAMVEGAVHGMTPCTAVEMTPGQFGDTMKTTFDYIDSWTCAHL